MFPSSTVENYLKAIYQHQSALESGALVPMGQLAASMGVVPGTATTMVKTLADSGLVRYEPYVGVRLTRAGEKLAAIVLRRHRLIELFLVQVMGMDWTDVHVEAEQLEHAVSDRMIERMDEMLGHPAVDPHGDPIPDPEGTLAPRQYQDLLTCPLGTPVVVTRLADQDAGFLRFIENSDLKPGRTIEIEARDAAADSVQVRGKDDRRITLGMRAASKVLVEVIRALIVAVALGGGVANAQTPASPPDSARPFEILDNSFLVEEAFNQEAGIFQNIFGIHRIDSSDWVATFTQEWPVVKQDHQLSYTLPFVDAGSGSGIGDLLINYRYQALTEAPGRPAFSPRFSLILPSGNERRARGNGEIGWQVNLPLSKQSGDLYWHGNAGFTYLPGPDFEESDLTSDRPSALTPHLAGSAILRIRPLLNLMLESVLEFPETTDPLGGLGRETVLTLSPGVRGGWDMGDRQLIVGVAVPVTFANDDHDTGIFGYLSYELPFRQ